MKGKFMGLKREDHKIQYQNQVSFGETGVFSIELQYEIVSALNEVELELTLDQFLKNYYSTMPIRTVVTGIKTIARNLKEELIRVCKIDSIGTEVIQYDFGVLTDYRENQKVYGEMEQFSYNNQTGIQLSISNQENSVVSNYGEEYGTHLKENMMKLRFLKTPQIQKNLTREEELVCLMYQLFFDKVPDFRFSQNCLKTQMMIATLCPFLSIGELFDLSLYKEIPISNEIALMMRRLALFGPITESEYTNHIDIASYEKEQIYTSGKHIRDYLFEHKVDELKLLKKIGILSYYISMGWSSEQKMFHYIRENTNYSEKEIQEGTQFIKKFNDWF